MSFSKEFQTRGMELRRTITKSSQVALAVALLGGRCSYTVFENKARLTLEAWEADPHTYEVQRDKIPSWLVSGTVAGPICTGSILEKEGNNAYVLSAAHCMNDNGLDVQTGRLRQENSGWSLGKVYCSSYDNIKEIITGIPVEKTTDIGFCLFVPKQNLPLNFQAVGLENIDPYHQYSSNPAYLVPGFPGVIKTGESEPWKLYIAEGKYAGSTYVTPSPWENEHANIVYFSDMVGVPGLSGAPVLAIDGLYQKVVAVLSDGTLYAFDEDAPPQTSATTIINTDLPDDFFEVYAKFKELVTEKLSED